MKNGSGKIIKVSLAIFTGVSASSTLIASIINIIWLALRTIYSINPTDTSKEGHSNLIIRNFYIRINNVIHNKSLIIKIYIIFEKLVILLNLERIRKNKRILKEKNKRWIRENKKNKKNKMNKKKNKNKIHEFFNKLKKRRNLTQLNNSEKT